VSIDILPESFSRVTAITRVVPVSGKPDLTDPSTGRTVVPAFVKLYLRRNEGVPGGDRDFVYVSVSGPRRLKSYAEGKQISCFGWERERNRGTRHTIDRPEWLALVIFGLMPDGWPLRLVDLTDEVAS
jgi:hypothetical protein